MYSYVVGHVKKYFIHPLGQIQRRFQQCELFRALLITNIGTTVPVQCAPASSHIVELVHHPTRIEHVHFIYGQTQTTYLLPIKKLISLP